MTNLTFNPDLLSSSLVGVLRGVAVRETIYSSNYSTYSFGRFANNYVAENFDYFKLAELTKRTHLMLDYITTLFDIRFKGDLAFNVAYYVESEETFKLKCNASICDKFQPIVLYFNANKIVLKFFYSNRVKSTWSARASVRNVSLTLNEVYPALTFKEEVKTCGGIITVSVDYSTLCNILHDAGALDKSSAFTGIEA